ncbi:MAG TPA: D-Ala-D-Ala carboxypeptidase family metallohydrolase [Casimicrobiaceae bacterium]|nr:D-Ala-D-Ala carboxypeptidase family metallohydrolase [Casimicrobiaceae bacterium]
MNLSPHFTLEELVASQTAARLAIDNQPPAEIVERMRRLLAPGLEQIRAMLASPVHVTSGYRSAALNAAIPGAAANSQHTRGEAADILVPAVGGPYQVCRRIIASGIAFDQLIFEYGNRGWCHVSFAAEPRHDVRSKFNGTTYLAGLQPDPAGAVG